MTNDQDVSDDSFQVVLIDLQKAANFELHCVKKPLTEELHYVAISYRWGELEEIIIDTGVGYVASITSFDMNDFYRLCLFMTGEPTMRSIDYVWVDAICVNQSNHNERKSTIYHMSEIYEHATWILAVPDLHAAHLKAMRIHFHIISLAQEHRTYLYHLVHGNTDKLHDMDQAFLDRIGVPPDQKLRRLLTKYTKFFAESFMTLQEKETPDNDNHVLAHLHNMHSTVNTTPTIHDSHDEVDDEIASLHECHEPSCPFTWKFTAIYRHRDRNEWHRDIMERNMEIRQVMHFLTDLVVDWSSRVWVISEFHISKKKNNLKFWFNQLDSVDVTFFTFDIHDPRFKAIQNTKPTRYNRNNYLMMTDSVYLTFYQQLINQLNRQSFLEMMLKSKASKNEDRFYSIFPLFPEYKQFIQNKELVNNVNSILSVKLKLYKIMTNEHKKLLYFSGMGNKIFALPTFATSLVNWRDPFYNESFASGIASVHVDITLWNETTDLPYLKLKPSAYWFSRDISCQSDAPKRALAPLLKSNSHIDAVMLWPKEYGCLLGSFDENIWIYGSIGHVDFGTLINFECQNDLPDDFPGFHVY